METITIFSSASCEVSVVGRNNSVAELLTSSQFILIRIAETTFLWQKSKSMSRSFNPVVPQLGLSMAIFLFIYLIRTVSKTDMIRFFFFINLLDLYR